MVIDRLRKRSRLLRSTGRRASFGSHERLAVAVLVTAALLTLSASSALGAGPQRYPAYRAAVAKDGPIAQYRFQDPIRSSSLVDSIGQANAANHGVELARTGPFTGAHAGKFDGGAYAALPANPLATATTFTAEAWIDWTGRGSGQQVFDFGSDATDYIALTPSSRLRGHPMLFKIRSGPTDYQLTAPPLPRNTWEYVAISEGPTGTVTLYVNGRQVAQSAATIDPAALPPGTDNWFGRSQVAGEPGFNGLLSNVAFYSKALKAARISAHYAAAESPVKISNPTISGDSVDGQTLTANPGKWSGAGPLSYSYRWESCSAAGAGCSDDADRGSTYQLGPSDVGTTLEVVVTATGPGGSSSATSRVTGAVGAASPVNTLLPSISGTAADGQVLTASAGSWSGTPPLSYSYQWQSCSPSASNCADVIGQTGSTYQLGPGDVGRTLDVSVTATNSAGVSTATSVRSPVIVAIAPSSNATPSISGTAQTGQTLEASTGSWPGDPVVSYAYQWQNCDPTGANCWYISGANNPSYLVPNWEAGETIDVVVTASTSGGSASATSVPTSDVQSRNIAPATTYFQSSFWDQPIPANAPLDPQSAAMSNQLLNMALGVAPMENYNCRQASYLSQTNSWSSWNSSEQAYCHQVTPAGDIQTTTDTPTVYTVGPNQPDVSVTIPANTNLQAAMQSVPIPSGAEPSMGGDAQMIIWQPSSDTMWELWQTSQDSSGQWHANWGGRIEHVSTDPGYYHNIVNANDLCSTNSAVKYCEQANWGGPSARVPNLPGLMTLAQLESGHVDHALAMALPESLAAAWSWPAQATDGPGNSIIPQGARIRIDPNLNLDAWFASLKNPDGTPRPIAPIEWIIARAMQTYGAVDVNSSGSVSFYTENWTPSGNDIFDGAGGLFGGMRPYQFVGDLPWESTQVLQTNMCNNVQPGSNLYQTTCYTPQYVTANPNPPSSNRCPPPLAASPQQGQTNGPSITITSPTWPNIGARVIFSAFVTDPSGVTQVDFLIDGQLRYVSNYPHCAMNRMQYTMGGEAGFWDAESESRGPHTLEVAAFDSLGNESAATETVNTDGP